MAEPGRSTTIRLASPFSWVPGRGEIRAAVPPGKNTLGSRFSHPGYATTRRDPSLEKGAVLLQPSSDELSSLDAPMNCPSCSASVPQAAKFCSECGAALPRACGNCGHINPASARFCSECGAQL